MLHTTDCVCSSTTPCCPVEGTLSCRGALPSHSSSTSDFLWPKVNPVHKEVNDKSPIKLNYVLWVINFFGAAPYFHTCFLQHSLDSRYAIIATIIIHAYCTVFIGITKQWEPNKHWYVFITDSRKSWGCDSGTGKISYPPKAFVQQRKNKEKWCCWFWWFWEAKIHPSHPRSKQLAYSWQHRYQSTPTYLTV